MNSASGQSVRSVREEGKPATQEGGRYGQAYGGKWGDGTGESERTRES
jgi:hypothetical protein